MSIIKRSYGRISFTKNHSKRIFNKRINNKKIYNNRIYNKKEYFNRKNLKENLITVVFIILLGIADVLLFTYVTNINRYKQLSRTRLEDNDVVRNMDLDKKKYDDVINTALKGEGIDINIKDKTENTNDKIHTIDESSLNHVRKKLVKYVKNELIQEILEKNKKLSINIHIKVTSYMYYNSATTHLVEKICVNQLHIDDKVDYYLKNIYENAKYFPIVYLNSNKGSYPYDNSWGGIRNYGGTRRHEGTDIMYSENRSDVVPTVSISDGVIVKKGWLELGGNRLLIKNGDNMYYYYAHLASYAQGLEEGMKVKAGQLIGYMGNTGYGPEGTKGKFDVHLHFGMYYKENSEEISINPYFLLKFLDINKLYYK